MENTETKRFTAFIEQFPGVLAQGDSIEEVQQKLNKAWENDLDFIQKRDIQIEYSEPEQFVNNGS